MTRKDPRVKPEDLGHSTLGASSYYRWKRCPGSVRLIATVTEVPVSVYAQQGTAAHVVSATCLRDGHDAVDLAGQVVEGFEVDEDMVEAVQVHLDTVRSEQFLIGDAEMLIEAPVDLTALHPKLWGTVDVAVRGKSRLVIVDYKHGRGVPVNVVENDQMMYYALGIMRALPPATARAIHTVDLVVVQPRAPHKDGPVRRWTIDQPGQLGRFAKTLVADAQATENPDARLVPGDWCRFCPAAAICPALRETAQNIALDVFGAPKQAQGLSLEELGAILGEVDLIDHWIRAVQEHAINLTRAGTRIPGWKLVAKRPTRQWVDENRVPMALEALGMPVESIWTRKVISPTQAEKALPRASRELLEPLWQRVSSGTTLAPDADRRLEVDARLPFEPEVLT